MKIIIAYDGVLHHQGKNGSIRRELDNKVAYASFEPAGEFRKHKETVIASKYNTDKIELRVKNGDGAQWIQKEPDCDCICVFDEYHRNKKINECVKDKHLLSAAKVKKTEGKGYETKQMYTIPSSMKWLKNIAQLKSFTDLKV